MEDIKRNLHWKKNVSLFLIGQAVSLVGSSLVSYAVMWHVTLKTQSSVMMTIFTLATMLPMLFTSPFGGVWADRFNRKYVINLADGSIAAVTLIIALCFSFGLENIYLLFICSIVRSFGQGIQTPAVASFIPQITPKSQLVRINGINSSIQSFTMLGSPALAGVLLSIAPLQTILFIDVITAIIGISVLAFLVHAPKVKQEEQSFPKQSYLSDMKEGLTYIRAHKFIKRLFVVAAISSILFAPADFLTPLQMTRNFGTAVWRLTAIEILFSIGMILGGLILATWGGFKNKTITFVFGNVICGFTILGVGVATNFWFYLGCMGLCGISVSFNNTAVMSILQTKIDEDFMGRVFSVSTMIPSVMMSLGMVMFGPLGDIININIIMIGSGIGLILLEVYVFTDKILREAGE
ncbi:MAG: MFS transporter [Lactobacillales bacterium]|jgi:DHA3 family macrolide efflux protein-like MFS transporter|nr:MFS transporter [Lactobacillales bacterium]